MMDRMVAVLTDHQGFAAAGCHDLFPDRGCPPPAFLEVCEPPNVVDLDIFSGSTEFACVGRKSLKEFVAADVSVLAHECVRDLREWVGREGEFAELCIQRRFAVPLDDDPEALDQLAGLADDPAGIPLGHLGDR